MCSSSGNNHKKGFVFQKVFLVFWVNRNSLEEAAAAAVLQSHIYRNKSGNWSFQVRARAWHPLDSTVKRFGIVQL